MISLAIRNLIFTILHPGLVAVLIPYWIARVRIADMLQQPFTPTQYLGLLCLLIGLVMMFTCIGFFAIKGRGTLSPADPTKHLVTSGPYQYSRNPMYVGVMLILLGECMIIQMNAMWYYTLFISIVFYTFTVLIEEPRLRRDFGDSYRAYCQKVRRWI